MTLTTEKLLYSCKTRGTRYKNTKLWDIDSNSITVHTGTATRNFEFCGHKNMLTFHKQLAGLTHAHFILDLDNSL